MISEHLNPMLSKGQHVYTTMSGIFPLSPFMLKYFWLMPASQRYSFSWGVIAQESEHPSERTTTRKTFLSSMLSACSGKKSQLRLKVPCTFPPPLPTSNSVSR
jgi:hypothetical protein